MKLTHQPIELGSIHRLRRIAGSWEMVRANEIDHLGELRFEHS